MLLIKLPSNVIEARQLRLYVVVEIKELSINEVRHEELKVNSRLGRSDCWPNTEGFLHGLASEVYYSARGILFLTADNG